MAASEPVVEAELQLLPMVVLHLLALEGMAAAV
jgi:hypothetical protein